jgi:hypothetical protein
MSIKTLPQYIFLLSLSLTVSSHATEEEPLSPSRKINTEKLHGVKREGGSALESERENKRAFTKEDSIPVEDIPEEELVEAARKMYQEKDEDRWCDTMIRIVSLKQEKSLKSEIMWVSFARYLFSKGIKSFKDEDQVRAKQLMFYVANESIDKKTPGYYWSINMLLKNFVECIRFESMVKWMEELMPAEWRDLRDEEKTIISDSIFWDTHSRLFSATFNAFVKILPSCSSDQVHRGFRLLDAFWDKINRSKGRVVPNADKIEKALTDLESEILRTDSVPYTFSSDDPATEGTTTDVTAAADDDDGVTVSYRFPGRVGLQKSAMDKLHALESGL